MDGYKLEKYCCIVLKVIKIFNKEYIVEIELKGILRRVYTHKHDVHIYHNSSLWESSNIAHGSVFGLGLNGDFRIDIKFKDSELEDWLDKFVEEYPEKGLMLIYKIQKKAIKKLISTNKKNKKK